jgi:hypothetical protein
VLIPSSALHMYLLHQKPLTQEAAACLQLMTHVHEADEADEHTAITCRRRCVGLQIQMPQSGQSRHRRMHLC